MMTGLVLSRVFMNSKKWIGAFALGIVFLLIGYFNGQWVDIYQKAIVICLECIGIG